MNKCIPCLLALLSLYSPASPQYYFYDANHLEPELRWEAGFSLGLMNCLTDLGGHRGKGQKFIKDLNWKNSRPCLGLFILATYHDVFAVRLESSWGQVSSFDSVLKNDRTAAELRYKRNLHFRSRIAEVAALIEFHPFFLINSEESLLLSPYLMGGFAYFVFNPQAMSGDGWIELQPLHTEGQGFKEFPQRQPYKLKQINFPVGVGLRYDVSTFLNMRFELIYRILRTDYLDDVSTNYIDPIIFHKHFQPAKAAIAERLADRQQELDPFHSTIEGSVRGNPEDKDAYFSFNLKLSVILNRKRYN